MIIKPKHISFKKMNEIKIKVYAFEKNNYDIKMSDDNNHTTRQQKSS